MQNHDCFSVIIKVSLALDGELSEEEKKQFLSELECCVHCLEKFEIEKSFREFLVQSILSVKMQPNLIASIRGKINGLAAGQ